MLVASLSPKYIRIDENPDSQQARETVRLIHVQWLQIAWETTAFSARQSWTPPHVPGYLWTLDEFTSEKRVYRGEPTYDFSSRRLGCNASSEATTDATYRWREDELAYGEFGSQRTEGISADRSGKKDTKSAKLICLCDGPLDQDRRGRRECRFSLLNSRLTNKRSGHENSASARRNEMEQRRQT